MARPLTSGVERPPCPQGHDGLIYLDGRITSGLGHQRYGRQRFRCIPKEPGERPHVFRLALAQRRLVMSQPGSGEECGHCERTFGRARGYAGAARFAFVVRQIATSLVLTGQA